MTTQAQLPGLKPPRKESPTDGMKGAARTPSPRFSCIQCGFRWSALNLAHCAACCRSFSGPDLFDRHRADVHGKGTCIDPTGIMIKPRGGAPERPRMRLVDGVWKTADEFDATGIFRGGQ